MAYPSYGNACEGLVHKSDALPDTANIQRDALRLPWYTYQRQDIYHVFVDHVSDAGRKDTAHVTLLLARL